MRSFVIIASLLLGSAVLSTDSARAKTYNSLVLDKFERRRELPPEDLSALLVDPIPVVREDIELIQEVPGLCHIEPVALFITHYPFDWLDPTPQRYQI